ERGMEYIVNGKISQFRHSFNIVHPEMEPAHRKKIEEFQTFVPVYRSTEKLSKRGLDTKGRARIMRSLIGELTPNNFEEYLPSYLIKKYKFPGIYETIRWIHYPANMRQLKAAENRIIFEEFFFLQLRLIKQYISHKQDLKGHRFESVGKAFNDFYHDHLPFELTGAQKRVLREI